jgi:serine/threonine protein kinase
MSDPSDPYSRDRSRLSLVSKRLAPDSPAAEKRREPTQDLGPDPLAIPPPLPKQETLPEPQAAAYVKLPRKPPGGGAREGSPALVRELAHSLEPQNPAWEDLKPGDRIGPNGEYEIIRLIGQGGNGTVYKARQLDLPRHVAIKLLNVDDEADSRRLMMEAQATAKVAHENIVSIYGTGWHRGRLYLALEFIDGAPLKELLEGDKRLPPGRAVEIAVGVVRALANGHAKGIIHRDLKPENLMLSRRGVVKVLDYGIFKHLADPLRRFPTVEPLVAIIQRQPSEVEFADIGPKTADGVIQGTLKWMSPEQYGAGGPIDARTDIFSLGLILYRMLSGKHPLGKRNGLEYAAIAKLNERLPRLTHHDAPGVPEGLADVVDRCLAKRKEDRYPDALELLRALEPFLPGHTNRGQARVAQNPYPGLSSFQESEANCFFGRDLETIALVNSVRDRPMTVLTGASGVGKSSLARAALAPALKGSGEGWAVIFLRPGRDPLAALAAAIAAVVGTDKSGTVIEDLENHEVLAQRIRSEPGFPGRMLRALAARTERKVLVGIDQFEEVYTLGYSESDRVAFAACLAGIADDASSPLRLLLNIRSDYLGRLADDRHLSADLGPALFFLATPDAKNLRAAIEGPAASQGYEIEPAVVVHMLEHLQATTGALPLLQFTMSRFWEVRDPSAKRLTAMGYSSIGGVAGALSKHADAVIAALSPHLQSAARDLFLRLVTPEKTAAVLPLEDLRELAKGRGEIDELIEQLVRARLLVVEKGERGSTVEIVHDSLIQGWPTLARWLSDAGDDVGFLERLTAASKLWSTSSRDSDALWRGELLRDAASFQKRFRGELSRLERAFLEASFALEMKEARSKRRRVMAAMGLLGAAALASFVAVGIIAKAKYEAVQQAQIARQAGRGRGQETGGGRAKSRGSGHERGGGGPGCRGGGQASHGSGRARRSRSETPGGPRYAGRGGGHQASWGRARRRGSGA